MTVENPISENSANRIRIGFLLTPNYSLSELNSAIEPLRIANNLTSSQTRYEWRIYTLDGLPVVASDGIRVQPDHAITMSSDLDMLFVCSSARYGDNYSTELNYVLNKFSAKTVPLGGLGNGVYLLARCGLLNKYHCVCHWEQLPALRAEFPSIDFAEQLFAIDRDRYTCAGGSTCFDLMTHIVKRTQADIAVDDITRHSHLDRIREPNDPQRKILRTHHGRGHTSLMEAVKLMEENLEEPIATDEIAVSIGVSRRQLERLFRKFLGCVPTHYYREIRLKHARRLLQHTDKSVMETATACGFGSASHFSKCYRETFRIPPSQERQPVS